MTPSMILFYGLIFLFILYIAISTRTVDERFRVPVFVFGRYRWTAGPGIAVIPLLICRQLKDVSVVLRTGQVTVENARTKDNVPLAFELTLVTRVLPDRVRDVILKIESGRTTVEKQLDAIAVEIAGHTEYENIQGKEKDFSTEISSELKRRVSEWGIEVYSIDMSNIKITDPVIAEAIARVAQAKIDAKAEDILSQELLVSAARYGKTVFELRQVIALERVAAGGKGSVFAFPSGYADVLSSLSGPGKPITESLADNAASTAGAATAGAAS